MSFKSVSKHLSLSPSQIESIENEIKKFVSKDPLRVDNKQITSLFKSLVKKLIPTFSLQQGYEVLSMLSGFKNYNIALSQNVDFKQLFVKFPVMVNSSNEVISSLTSKRNWKIPSLAKSEQLLQQHLPTGISFIDSSLGGGLFRKKVCVAFSEDTYQSSLLAISTGANSIRLGFKVLHISINNSNSDIFNKYYANLTGSKYYKNQVNDKKEEGKISSRLVTKEFFISPQGGPTSKPIIFKDIELFCNKAYQSFQFDQIIIEGMEQFSRDKLHNNTLHYLELNRTYKKFIELTQKYNCSGLTPLISLGELDLEEIKQKEPRTFVVIKSLRGLPSTTFDHSFVIIRDNCFTVSTNIEPKNKKNLCISLKMDKNLEISTTVKRGDIDFNLAKPQETSNPVVKVSPPYSFPNQSPIILANPPYSKVSEGDN